MAMQNCEEVIAEAFSLRVFLAENIPDPRMTKGWIADVSVGNQVSAGIALDLESAKALAVVIAKHLFEKIGQPFPTELDNLQWQATK